MTTCQRCSDQTHLLEKCTYCRKYICRKCEKSARRLAKINRLIICKDCWGNMATRMQFKSAKAK